jgi:hypothetical protein
MAHFLNFEMDKREDAVKIGLIRGLPIMKP